MSIKNNRIFKFFRKKHGIILQILITLCAFLSNVNKVYSYEIEKYNKFEQYGLSETKESLYHTCPLCGIDNSNPRKIIELHKIFECSHLESISMLTYLKHNVSSYICKCKYAKDYKKGCGANMSTKEIITIKNSTKTTGSALVDIDHVNIIDSSLSTIKPCLIVHVGMAITGYNLMYRHWTNKENCFNLCINTTIKNGFDFDCASFEHWQADCALSSTTTTTSMNNSVCASFVNDYIYGHGRRHRRFGHKFKKRYERNSIKIDYCVLSNQTIALAGNKFTTNDAVTYYELLCESNFVVILLISAHNLSIFRQLG